MTTPPAQKAVGDRCRREADGDGRRGARADCPPDAIRRGGLNTATGLIITTYGGVIVLTIPLLAY